jgi:repressor of nif and glnA expression
MIPAVIGDVVKLMKHDMENIRKRAVCALHRLHQMDKHCLVEHVDLIRRAICDKGQSVLLFFMSVTALLLCRSECDGRFVTPDP